MARLVSCSEKRRSGDVHDQITSIGGTKRDGTGWVKWTKTQAGAIAEIEAGEQTYYVNIGGATPNLGIAIHKGVKYLKAPADLEGPTALLGLPDC